MSAGGLLPAQRSWVAQVCERLTDGQTVIVRGIPGSGKTVLLKAVARELGPTGVLTFGRDYTPDNQADRTATFQEGVLHSLSRYGSAQLLFDDYAHALRNPEGLRLQRQLLQLLVDGEYALDMGALLTGRWGRSMHLVSSGSPLVARARVVALPHPGSADFEAVGCAGSAEAAEAVGGNAALLAKVVPVLGRAALHQVRDSAQALVAKWVEDVPWEAVAWIKGVVREGPAALPEDDSALEALAPLLVPAARQPDGLPRYGVVEALRTDEGRAALDGRAPTWPSRRQDSVKAFCAYLSGVPEAVWVDRYMAVKPADLLRFVQEVRGACSTRLRLLVAKNRNDMSFTEAEAAAFARHDCTVRVMLPGDRRLLHDRQLVFLGSLEGGVVLPTARVLMGQDLPGSAVAVRARNLDRKLILNVWERARPVS
ncbi:hypothetical protein C0Q98_15115 [Streptomyces albidoflavus]|uniref:ATP-binding protein n=1 Tax=Streptomyces TaxID=1883 RepID=UPI001021164D|nr:MULTISPECIES: ATP-binding protein [Streptomyces]MEE1721790.1 ATP-binding protein [Streptomyces sp. JV186]RZE21500.1 hypothetical protein C0Q93_14890 [Streptomyces albidoflavus]RZE59055.1 hypothetical protein C0Q98_15115 [Streptomyces albidoflavus]